MSTLKNIQLKITDLLGMLHLTVLLDMCFVSKHYIEYKYLMQIVFVIFIHLVNKLRRDQEISLLGIKLFTLTYFFLLNRSIYINFDMHSFHVKMCWFYY